MPAVITGDCKMAASSCNEDLCLPGVYIFPITLEQSQLSTGCYLKTNNYRCSYPCLAGTLTVGPKQRSSRVQQLVQQQELAASPSCCPPAALQLCSSHACLLAAPSCCSQQCTGGCAASMELSTEESLVTLRFGVL